MIIPANPGYKIAFAHEDGEDWFLTVCDIVAWKIEEGKDPEPIAIDAQIWLDNDTLERTIVAPNGTTDFGGTPDVSTWLECQKRWVAIHRGIETSIKAKAELQPTDRV
jgi:hypothetical protein